MKTYRGDFGDLTKISLDGVVLFDCTVGKKYSTMHGFSDLVDLKKGEKISIRRGNAHCFDVLTVQ
jgi:hypothetical protein